MGLMAGKRGLIMGIANERSLAWGIAKAVHAQGAEIAATYQGEAMMKRVVPLAESLGSKVTASADVTDPASLDALFERIGNEWGKIDFAVHAIGFTDKEALRGRYLDVTPETFAKTMHISVYSFTDLAKR